VVPGYVSPGSESPTFIIRSWLYADPIIWQAVIMKRILFKFIRETVLIAN
jgi:hypothetical protein